MTLTIIDGVSVYLFATNLPNADQDPLVDWTLTVTSSWSNLPVIQASIYPQVTNDRYTEWEVTLPSTLGLQHGNSMCNYTITEDGIERETGSLKLIYNPGGGTGTQPYISNNEDREAIVYYQPAY